MFTYKNHKFVSISVKLFILPALIATLAFGSIMAPVQTQAATTIDATSQPFGIDFVNVCKRVLKWRLSNRTDADGDKIPESYFDDESQAICVSQDNAYLDGQVKVAKYSDFETIPAGKTRAEIKAYFGDDTVMAVTSQQVNLYNTNGTVKTAGTDHNRATDTSLTKTFPQDYINNVWKSGGDKVGIPLRFDTGSNTYTVRADTGAVVYQGGLCSIANGQVTVRGIVPGLSGYNDLNITNFITNSLKKDAGNAKVACGRLTNGVYKPTAEDKNLLAYQYIYEYNLPKTQAECNIIYVKSAKGGNVDFDACVAAYKTLLRNLFATSVNTTGDFSRVLVVNTYYASFDDSSQPVRGVNYVIKPSAATGANHIVIENSAATGPSYSNYCLTNGTFDANKCINLPEPTAGQKVMIRATASAVNSITDQGSDTFKSACLTGGNFDKAKCYYIPKSGLVGFIPSGGTVPEVGRADRPGDTVVDLDKYFQTTGGAPSFKFINADGDVTENFAYSSLIIRRFIGWKNPNSDLFQEPRRTSDSAFARDIAESTVVLK